MFACQKAVHLGLSAHILSVWIYNFRESGAARNVPDTCAVPCAEGNARTEVTIRGYKDAEHALQTDTTSERCNRFSQASSAIGAKSVICVAADALIGVVNGTVPCSETSMSFTVLRTSRPSTSHDVKCSGA